MTFNFDRVADKYDATRGFPAGVADQVCTWVLSRLPTDPAVAEIGIGTGRIAVPFIERGIRYTGFDVSEEMTARLRAKVNEDLKRSQVFIADITEPLPVAEHSQDAAIAVHILHLVDAVKTLEQVRRILKPHGALAWGYTLHDRTAPQYRIRPKYYEITAELGAPTKQDFFAQPARDALVEWGAQASKHTVATWSVTSTPRQALDGVRNKLFSSTWRIADHIHDEAMRRVEAWTKVEYPDLDQPHTYDENFIIDWYQF